MGTFPNGSILRTAHVYEDRRFMGVGEYVRKIVVLDVMGATYISGENAQNYLNAIELEYRKPCGEHSPSVGDLHGPAFVLGGR